MSDLRGTPTSGRPRRYDCADGRHIRRGDGVCWSCGVRLCGEPIPERPRESPYYVSCMLEDGHAGNHQNRFSGFWKRRAGRGDGVLYKEGSAPAVGHPLGTDDLLLLLFDRDLRDVSGS